jgi:CBS-domain-containing membrane protein
MNIMNYKFTIAYIVSIVAVNIGFVYIPPVPLLGEMFPPMSLIVGLIFIARDFAQKEIGHKVLGAMAVGAILSYFMADPFVAIASVIAFAISEMVDWGVYTYTKRPLRDRILLSSALGTPVDSAVFLLILGFFSPLGFLLMTLAKMLTAVILWWRLNNEG